MPIDTKAVGGITLDLVPLEIDVTTNAEGIGSRDRLERLRQSSRLHISN